MLASGLHVKLPQAKAAEKLDQKPPVVLTFSKDGHVTLDGRDYNPRSDRRRGADARLGDDRTQSIHPARRQGRQLWGRRRPDGCAFCLRMALTCPGDMILTGPAGKTAPATSSDSRPQRLRITRPLPSFPRLLLRQRRKERGHDLRCGRQNSVFPPGRKDRRLPLCRRNCAFR